MHADTLRGLPNLRRRTGRPQGKACFQLAKIEDGGSDAEKELLIAVKAENPDASPTELLTLFQVSSPPSGSRCVLGLSVACRIMCAAHRTGTRLVPASDIGLGASTATFASGLGSATAHICTGTGAAHAARP